MLFPYIRSDVRGPGPNSVAVTSLLILIAMAIGYPIYLFSSFNQMPNSSFFATRTVASVEVGISGTDLLSSALAAPLDSPSAPARLITTVPSATPSPTEFVLYDPKDAWVPTSAFPSPTPFPWACLPSPDDHCLAAYNDPSLYWERWTPNPPTALPTERVFVTWTPAPTWYPSPVPVLSARETSQVVSTLVEIIRTHTFDLTSTPSPSPTNPLRNARTPAP